jgi:glycosyltransferase involved in cell wall biosynthesis
MSNSLSREKEKNMKTPKVSVCVMTYNQAKYIGDCLQSIVDQVTDFDFEVIVADDASSDGTREIILEFAAKYPEKLKPVLHEKNVGVGKNYRSAHDRATGEYVAHCDGDDLWLPGKLSYQVDLLDKNPDASQCWGCAHLIDDDGKRIGLFPSRLARWLNPTVITARHIALSYALVGQHSTQIYRRKFKFDFDVNKPVLDYWIAFNMALKGPAIYSKELVSCYRVTKSPSMTRSSGRSRATVDFLAMHLLDVIKCESKFASKAKANILIRYWISKIIGHDLSLINLVLDDVKNIKPGVLNVVKSLFYFLLQKVK